MNTLKNILGHGVTFVVLYILFMLPTYLLPMAGSNSLVSAAGLGLSNPATLLHLGALILLVIFCWIRGSVIDKKWLVIFPILALLFEFVPGLNFIPMIPTILHLIAIIVGAIGATRAVVVQSQLE